MRDNHSRKDALSLTIIMLFFTAAWLVAWNTTLFYTPDSLDYAQMAREIEQGNGMMTLQIFPRHIPYLHKENKLASLEWPNLHRYPLASIIGAGINTFTDDIIKAAVTRSGIFFLLTLPLIFYIARQFCDTLTASIAVIFFSASPLIYRSAYDGMTESQAIFFTVAAASILLSNMKFAYKWIAVGVMCGLAFLTRTQIVYLLPLAALMPFVSQWKTKKMLAVTTLIISFGLTISPWMLRNLAITDDPFFSFSNTRNFVVDAPEHPGFSDIDMMLHAPTERAEVFSQYGEQIFDKIRSNFFPEVISPAYWLTAFGVMSPFFILSLLSLPLLRKKDNDDKLLYLIIFTLMSIVFIFIISCVALHTPRHYVYAYPFITITGLITLKSIASTYIPKLAVRYTNIFMTGLMAVGLAAFLYVAQYYYSYPPSKIAHVPYYRELSSLVDEDQVVASDNSHMVSLYAQRHAIRLPIIPADLLEINEKYIPIDYVIFSDLSLYRKKNPMEKPSIYGDYTVYRDFINAPEFKSHFQLRSRQPGVFTIYERNPSYP